MLLDTRTVWAVAAQPPSGLALATRDLARDWRSAFGRNPTMEESWSGGAPAVVIIGAAAAQAAGVPLKEVEAEGYCIEVVSLPGENADVLALCGYGSTTRGDIYAVYALSSLLFGVEPFDWWTDKAVVRRSSVVVDDEYLALVPPPRFAYRGWFLNDEDLLTEWSQDPTGRTGISIEVWDKLFEALLRCRGNIVVPGTFIFSQEPQVALASRRGLIIAQDHLEVLGVNTYRWPDDAPYSYAAHPEVLEGAWAESVAAYGDSEVIWSVGYRGRHDRPFWYDDESAGAGPAERGALISAAISAQMRIVRERRPDAEFFLNLWMEGVELQRDGHLVIPEDVAVVWPDDGHGRVLGGGSVRPGDGAYYHTAMYNSFAAQLTEMVPLETIEQEIEKLYASGASRLILVNVSDLRPCLMTTGYLMQLAIEKTDVRSGYTQWAASQYGLGDVGADLWRRYFNSGFKYAEYDEIRLEDNAYHTLAHLLLKQTLAGRFDTALHMSVIDAHIPRAFRLLEGRTLLEAAELLLDGTRAAQKGWDTLAADAAKTLSDVLPERRLFYGSHIVLQVQTHRCGNAMLGLVAQAVVSLKDGDAGAGIAALSAARSLSEEVLDLQRDAEYGKWTSFYAGDTCVDVPFTSWLLEHAAQAVQSGLWPAENDQPTLPVELSPYRSIKRYQTLGNMWVDVARKPGGDGAR